MPAGEELEIQLFGSDRPLVMKQDTDEKGFINISFWHDKGRYELFFRGKRVWEFV